MIIWIDAQLDPRLAEWLRRQFGVDAHAVRDLGLVPAKDPEIFKAARDAGAAVMTKDSDFVDLVGRHGPPPQVLWVACGNTSNARMRQILTAVLPAALDALASGEPLVEIADPGNQV